MTELRKVALFGEVSGQTVAVVNENLQVVLQDQFTRSVDFNFIQAVAAPTTLAVATAPEDTTITLASTTGFVAGGFVGIFDVDDKFYVGHQIGAPAGSVITLDVPIDIVYPIGAIVLPAKTNMNVDGSSTPQIFQIGGSASELDIDITRIMGYIQSGSAMDDSLFGSLAALTKGCLLRRADGTLENLWHVKTNGDLALIGFDFTYTPNAPSGSFGARFRITYAGQDKHGVSIRLAAGDSLQFLIQDNLTGLEVFNLMGQGHWTQS